MLTSVNIANKVINATVKQRLPGLASWKSQGAQPPMSGFFVHNTLAPSFYVGMSEAAEMLAGSLCPVGQPYSARHHDWSHVCRFLTETQGFNHV